MRSAIVLGGGRSSRMGTDKLALDHGGATLLARTCAAAARVAGDVVVAGHEQPRLAVRFVAEDPPFGGPVAGIAAAVSALVEPPTNERRSASTPEEVLVLAGDLANPEAVVDLLAAAEPGADGVVLEDSNGWPQYLAGRYRLASLRRALDEAGELHGLPVRKLMAGLGLARVPAPPSVTADVDEPGDVRWLA